MCAGAGTSESSRLSVNSSNHSGRSRNRSPDACSLLLFLLLFWDVFALRRFPDACLSLRSVAGLEDVLDESCGGDVEDELVPEFDDNPGTTRGTKISVLHKKILPMFGQPWFVTARPLIGISIFFAELSKCSHVHE